MDATLELCAAECYDLVWVGLGQPPDRWRQYLSYEPGTTPTEFRGRCERQHHRFVAERDRSARSAVQLVRLAQWTDGVYESDVVDTLLFHAQFALLELRAAELRLIGYQLILGTLGFHTRDHDRLYLATLQAHELWLLLWKLTDTWGAPGHTPGPTLRERQQARPLRTESVRQLAHHLYNLVHHLQPFATPEQSLHRVWARVQPVPQAFATAQRLLARWGCWIRALDLVARPLAGDPPPPLHPTRPPGAPDSVDMVEVEHPPATPGGEDGGVGTGWGQRGPGRRGRTEAEQKQNDP